MTFSGRLSKTITQRSHSRWVARRPALRGLFLGAAGILLGAAPLVWALHLGAAGPFAVVDAFQSP